MWTETEAEEDGVLVWNFRNDAHAYTTITIIEIQYSQRSYKLHSTSTYSKSENRDVDQRVKK